MSISCAFKRIRFCLPLFTRCGCLSQCEVSARDQCRRSRGTAKALEAAMRDARPDRSFVAPFVLLTLLALAPTAVAPAQESNSDARAQETERKLTDDERFSLIVSLIGAVPSIGVPRDPRIPEDVTNMSAGYTPGLARLGIPALQSSDASMG